jgi:hypothetical protein
MSDRLQDRAFGPHAHPFEIRVSQNDMYGSYYIFVPMDAFRKGARCWQDINTAPGKVKAARAYSTMVQFIGEMLKFARKHGTVDEHNEKDSFMYTRFLESGQRVTVPKVRLLVHLLVRETSDDSALFRGDAAILPDHELFDQRNTIGIMLSLHIFDPAVKLIDLITDLVSENARMRDPSRRPYVSEEVKRKRPLTVAEGGEDEDEGEDVAADPAGAGAGAGAGAARGGARQRGGRAAGKNGGGKKKWKKSGGVGGRSRNGAPSIDASDFAAKMHTSYQTIDKLWMAISLLVDMANGTSHVADDEGCRSRSVLERMIVEGTDERVNLTTALSIETALERASKIAMSGCDGIKPRSPTSSQLTPEAYLHDPADDDPHDADGLAARRFGVPVPQLVWALMADEAASERLMSSPFPWKTTDLARMFAGIAARHINEPISRVLAGARLAADVQNLRGACTESLAEDMANADYVARRIGIAPQGTPASRGGSFCVQPTTIDDHIEELTGSVDPVTVSATKPLGDAANAVRGYVINYLLINKTNPRLPSMMRIARRTGGRDADVDNDGPATADGVPSKREMDEAVEELKTRCNRALTEIAAAARAELVSLFDVSARIPQSIKSCVMWLENRDDVGLGFLVHSRNLGLLSQILATMMSTIRQSGIAVNQWPVLLLMAARDTGYIPATYGLPIHAKLTGEFAAGKSKVMETVAAMSTPMSVLVTTGSSDKGALPTHAPPSQPFGHVMICYDELPGVLVEKGSRLSSCERSTQRQLGSMMTRRRIDYQTNTKGPGDTINWQRKTIITNANIAGATNAPDAQDMISSRMMPIPARPDVSGFRNTVNVINQGIYCNGRYPLVENRISEHLKTMHGLTMMALTAMEAGGLPLPDNERHPVYTGAAMQILKTNWPSLASRVRGVDSARTFVLVAAVWRAIAIAFSPQLGGGADIGKFSVHSLTRIMPYLEVTEEAAMIAVALMVYNATNPRSYAVLRWIAESCGSYPFITKHKAAARGTVPRADPADSAHADADTDADADADARAPMRAIPSYEEVLDTLQQYPPPRIGVPINPLNAQRKGRGGGRAAPRSRRAGGQQHEEGLTREQALIMELSQREGEVIEFPLQGKAATRRNLRQTAADILDSGLDTRHVKYGFKTEIVADEDGVQHLYLNPNYVAARGSIETFATNYIATNPGLKTSKEDIEAILEELSKKHVPAHLLPLIPIDDITTPIDIEAYRTQLWQQCAQTRAPMVVAAGDRWYILVESLLDGPKHIVLRTLQMLCNETTINRSIVLPIPDKNFPELLLTFDAKPVPGKRLRCANPYYAGPAERGTLSDGVRDAVERASRIGDEEGIGVADSSDDCPTQLEWSHARDLRAKRLFFEQNGIPGNPKDFTERALFDKYVTSKINARHSKLFLYPDDATEEMRVFDAKTRQAHEEFAQYDPETALQQQQQRRQPRGAPATGDPCGQLARRYTKRSKTAGARTAPPPPKPAAVVQQASAAQQSVAAGHH